MRTHCRSRCKTWRITPLRYIEACRRHLGRAGEQAETSVALIGDLEIRRLNVQWRGKDTATNVLSFPTAPGPATERHLGDIVIAYETVAREAATERKSFTDHLAHLSAHGYLHLVGHDHEEDAEAERMEQLEREILASMGIDDPYSETSPDTKKRLG